MQEDGETVARPCADTREAQPSGVAIHLQGVSVRAAGHPILEEIDLTIEAGSHVAIVGHSGAGKSSLVGLLLGWHRPAHGRILIDGEPLHGARLEQLRRETAWVDPSVQLWNRSFLENLLYGAPTDSSRSKPAGLSNRLTSAACSRNCLMVCKRLSAREVASCPVVRGSGYGLGAPCSVPGRGW